ncbi:hypothetical protein BGX21_000779 [Mortierella sp. AD011]|nr:hypothetical protein BGX20_007519 [Mortierella sp. AD010]KAF9386510.1 hypothetical protein BGX21_000779 [Mortierella sp. AD011]
MGSKSKATSSKRATAPNEPQENATPSSKRPKKSQDESPSIGLMDQKAGPSKTSHSEGVDADINMDSRIAHSQTADTEDDDEEDGDEIDIQDNERESSGDDTDVEDDEDQELRANSIAVHKKEAHTSDRVQKMLTNPEIDAAFHQQYMSQITQGFGDELNTLREVLHEAVSN